MKVFATLILFFLLQCIPPLYQRTNGPTHGLIFTQNKFPGEFNQNNDVIPSKRAEGCIHYFLFLAMWGDAGAGSIALQNKIKKIATIDHSTISVIGLYGNYCTIVRGD
jgi:TRL-like protein family